MMMTNEPFIRDMRMTMESEWARNERYDYCGNYTSGAFRNQSTGLIGLLIDKLASLLG